MRIYQPKNHLNKRLINDTEFLPSSIKVDRGVVNGVVTIDSTVLEDVENWEVASVSVIIDGEAQSFGADTVRKDDGSIEVVFGEHDEHLDFGQASIVLNRKYGNAYYAPQELTIEMRINRQMAKTLKEVGKPGYDKDANIEEWNLLAQEAYDTDPLKYEYAIEKTLSKFIEGPVINDCLLSINSFTYPVKPVPGLDSVIWNSDLPSMVKTDTYTIFEAGPELKEWNGLMPNLEDGSFMFSNCYNLASVVSELPSLVNGSSMFTSTAISSFNIQLPNLTNGELMFSNCRNLVSWDIEIPKIENASQMFSSCNSLKSWTADIPAGLQNASGMFQYCSGLTSWTVDLPNSITHTNSMFEGCSGLTSWVVKLPDSLTDASYMFYRCSGLSEWNVEMPASLTKAACMFSDCTGLSEWTVALPDSLGDASWMFSSCSGLTKWTVEMPVSLTDASYMFYCCSGLSEWNVEMPVSLTNASHMFCGCTGLTSFNVNIPSGITDAFGMFGECKLDYASVERIAKTIPTKSGDRGIITIGIASADYDRATADFESMIVNKNWFVYWESNS